MCVNLHLVRKSETAREIASWISFMLKRRNEEVKIFLQDTVQDVDVD
jgi:hypothetical protein